MRKILHADQRRKQNHKKGNPPAFLQEQSLLEEENWIDLEKGKYFLHREKQSFFFVIHNKSIEKKEWRKIFRINSHNLFIGLTIGGKDVWQQGGDQKRKFQYCTYDSGKIVYLRALQDHSSRNLIDP